MNYKLATIISRLFDPFLTLAIVFVFLYWGTPTFLPALLLMIILPFALFVLAWKTKFISNWDVGDRRQRPRVLWILLAIEIGASVLLKTGETMPLLVALFGFTLISHFWKMSGHALAIGLMTGTIVARFGSAWWPILLAVPLVGWARVQTNNHTPAQVIAGALYAWFTVAVFYVL